MNCKLCGGEATPFGELVVLGRHNARYRRCKECGYVFVEAPEWLAEAYADHAITALDTGMVVRNLWLVDAVDVLLRWRFRQVRNGLDYGAGNGLFVRMMRDRGYDFRWTDLHCENVFALGFEAEPGQRFDFATCFEVAEHLPDPLAVFEDLTRRAPILLFSTELLPEANNRPGEWHYYTPETGHHIGFFTAASLQRLAQRLGRHFATDGRMLHAFSSEPLDPRWLRFIAKHRRARWLLRLGRRRKALTWRDGEELAQRLHSQQSTHPPP
ncbi:MAG: class I SAM-dependent methyltransferase [Rhodanobacteraceae bacterium]